MQTRSSLKHIFVRNGIFIYSAISPQILNKKLEFAQKLACHESARTTGLYDRRDDEVSLDEIEKIMI